MSDGQRTNRGSENEISDRRPSREATEWRNCYILILGCLHPVARVRSGVGFFYLSMQRHYRRLIYYLYIILLHASVVRPSSGRKYINS
jgi:hypothetical protein